jgi:hypothetical protein
LISNANDSYEPELDLVLSWEEGDDPANWRNLPDPDPELDEDPDDIPSPDYVVDTLGFDPDELWI